MVILTDGRPYDHDYGDAKYAREDVREALREAMALEMVLTGVIQFICLAACLTYAYWREEFTPMPIRLRARTIPPRGLGYSATSATSAPSA